ncbi:helix-turn-helix domain-containing protein [Methylorubrum populi]|uniref:helix-turn-helix domain-containing protein n=1 Tax=Methylorubrum populi TaxID=223967 RepID=UPI0012659353|nr:helix-turn-helix domain-containing protein [Methylorubrum populi]
MGPKAADTYSYPPRGLCREAAARYLGIPTELFDDLIQRGQLPGPRFLGGTAVWDRHHLDAALEVFPTAGSSSARASTTARLEAADPPHPNVYTPETLAQRWRCSANHVRNMVKRGDLPAFRSGGRLLRIRTADVISHEAGEPR